LRLNLAFLILIFAFKKAHILRQHHILDTSIEFLKGVGPLKGALLAKELGIVTFGDLLEHFPYRYLDVAKMTQINDLSPENDWVYLCGIIRDIREEGSSFKKRLSVTLADNSGQMDLVWFQGAGWMKNYIQPGATYLVFGKLTFFNGSPTITHPEIELFNASSLAVQNSLQPVYSTTEKLKAKGISNRSFAKLIQELIPKISEDDIFETLPNPIIQQFNLMSRYEAYLHIHFPKDELSKQRAEYRLKWEELFLLQLRMAKLKVKNKEQAGFCFPKVGKYFNSFFEQHLPFQLTEAQKRVLREVREDTVHGHQMNRLLQGDVGSGKTIVAVMAMLLAIDNGFQACLMAPTEILAQQHYEGISTLLAPLDIPVALLSGSVKGKKRKEILAGIAGGAFPIVVGTHALVEDTVKFQQIGLAIIDEQHRFGVHQRSKLWTKNYLPPHVLVMTATPIPRTLAMAVYGDLDVSVIDELPPGRKPIHTIHRSENYRPKVMQFLKTEIEKGRQIYIVYPLIDESEKLDFESLMAGIEQVKTWFPEPKYRVAMVHGKQKSDERLRNMERFVSGHAHILVATTVIEVGVNVPNASVMVIESAQRFGLSQLHQLRGRVGRGSEKSYCVLLTNLELSKDGRQRMHIMTQTNDGFLIAEEDMKMRGPGDIYGTKQSGALQFKIADIMQDVAIMEETKKAALQILEIDPMLQQPEYRTLNILLNRKSEKQSQPWSRIS